MNYVQFAKEIVELNLQDSAYTGGELKFTELNKNASHVAFDTNFGSSIARDVEIFAAKTWIPFNAVKIFTFDYNTN